MLVDTVTKFVSTGLEKLDFCDGKRSNIGLPIFILYFLVLSQIKCPYITNIEIQTKNEVLKMTEVTTVTDNKGLYHRTNHHSKF